MAKQPALQPNDRVVSSIPGDEEIALLESISENCIPNRSEIISLYSSTFDRTVHISRDDVYKMASTMASNNQISHVFGIDRKTLAKHFSRELNMARAFARQKVIARFYHLVMNNAHPAYVIFAMKNWAGMSDNGMVEELGETDEGVEFKVKRPQKPIESLTAAETKLDIEQADEE